MNKINTIYIAEDIHQNQQKQQKQYRQKSQDRYIRNIIKVNYPFYFLNLIYKLFKSSKNKANNTPTKLDTFQLFNIIAISFKNNQNAIFFIFYDRRQIKISILQFLRMGCENSNMVHNNFIQLEKIDQSNSSDEKQNLTRLSPLKQSSAQLSGRQIILINTAIQKHILFYKLSQDQRMKLISSMQKFNVSSSTYIFKVNEEPDYAYIVDSGTVRIELTKEGREIKKLLREGNIFGDLALINQAKRSASAYAETDCSLIALSKQNFQKKMEELAKEHHHTLFNYIDNAPVFKKLTQTQKNSLSSHMHEIRFQKNDIIFNFGDFANCIYLVKSGEVEVTVPQRTSIILKQGDVFGEGSLKHNSIRRGQARALMNTYCFVISRAKLSLCVQAQDIQDITFHCIIRWALKRTNQFAKVSKTMIEKIIESGMIEVVEDRTVMATAGQQLTKLMICLQGQVVIEDLYKTLTKQNQQILGVGCILNEDYTTPIKSPFTITKKQRGSVFIIDHRTLNAIFHPTPHRMSISLQLMQPQFTLKDLQLVKKIQSSLLTSKYLVIDKRTKANYVMHVFNKFQTIQYKREKLLVNDKELSQSLKHPFVINLVKTFKDQNYVYFIYRDYLNFTLDNLIKRVNFPSNDTIDFIIMTLINLLQFLHKQFIIFRDLKPQNLILDRNGYPHLVSLMLAKKTSKANFITYTIIGTPHFLAPEVQQGLGYSFPSDYWSLGIIIYQLAIGYLPFADDKDDPYEIFLAIQRQKLAFPKSYTNKKVKKIIKLLLSKQSWNRPDHSSIKTCGYFNEITTQKWEQLAQGRTKCPSQIEKLISEFSQELAMQALNQTQGSFMALFERQKSKNNHKGSLSFDCSWDQCF